MRAYVTPLINKKYLEGYLSSYKWYDLSHISCIYDHRFHKWLCFDFHYFLKKRKKNKKMCHIKFRHARGGQCTWVCEIFIILWFMKVKVSLQNDIEFLGCSDGLSISRVSQTDDAVWESMGDGVGTNSELSGHISLEASTILCSHLFKFLKYIKIKIKIR